jgi:3-oxoacyl-[acyl-carrier protein] reductase
MKLEDLKVIITGGAQGMGAHFARRLAEAGAQVAVGDVKEDALAALVEANAGAPGTIHARALDVADEAQCESFVAWASEAMGGLNGLINNAGILRDGLLVKKDRATGEITKLTKAQWDAVIAVNLTGATLMVREVVAKMVPRPARPWRHRQHVVDRAPRQPRPVQLRGGQGRARRQHQDLGAGVRRRSGSASAPSPLA